jgi:hypothetical protein
MSTAKNAADQLDLHLLTELNRMRIKQHNSKIISGTSICSSQSTNINQLHNAIKQAYFELDKDLRKIVKDDSGCVCVNIKDNYFSKKKKILKIYLDHMSY